MLFGLECNSWLSSQDPLVEYKRSERGSCRLTVRRRFGRGIDRWRSSWLTYLENYWWLFTNYRNQSHCIDQFESFLWICQWWIQTFLWKCNNIWNIDSAVIFYFEVKLWGQLVFHHALDYYWLGQITVIPTLGFKTNQIIWKVLLQQYHKQGRFHNSTWRLFRSCIYIKSLFQSASNKGICLILNWIKDNQNEYIHVCANQNEIETNSSLL